MLDAEDERLGESVADRHRDSAARRELTEPRGCDAGRAGSDQDSVIGRMLGPSQGAVADSHVDVRESVPWIVPGISHLGCGPELCVECTVHDHMPITTRGRGRGRGPAY